MTYRFRNSIKMLIISQLQQILQFSGYKQLILEIKSIKSTQ